MRIAKLQPYPAYRPVIAPWLSALPAHWEESRVKAIVSEVTNVTDQRRPHEDYIALEHVESWTGKITHSDDEVSFGSQGKRFQAGDILFGKLRPYLAKVAQPRRNGVCVGEFLVLRPHDRVMTSGFLERLMRSKPVIDAVDASTFGAKMPRADWHFIGNLLTPLPPPDEQAAIVRYLDHADELINRYISAKDRLIALLEEQRQAVIHRAITRGLDSDVPLLPSGTTWIGDIPAHWSVRRLRTLVDISTGGKDTINAIDAGQYPFFVRSQTVERINTWSFDGEAVLTAGDGVGVGKVIHYVKGKFDYHQRVYKFSRFRGISGRLFYHYLRAMLPFMTTQGTAKSTVDSLRLPMLQNFPVVVPAPNEQLSLTRELDQIDASVNQAMQLARNQIDLMNEYRTRLIADVVTGQLDVRDAAIRIPD